jgi:hypothetical protein
MLKVVRLLFALEILLMPDWTMQQQKLFDAVYRATENQKRYAPTTRLGADQSLRRTVPTNHVRFKEMDGKSAIEPSNLTMVVDLKTNPNAHNRWTGTAVPPPPGNLAVPSPTRGGLYFSQDLSAGLSERFHYRGLTRAGVSAITRIARAFEPTVLVTTETKRSLDLVNIDFFSPETRRFISEIGGDARVEAALKAMGPDYLGTDGRPSLLKALFNAHRDYASSRALGLALAAEQDYDGLLVTSAQGYEPEGGGWHGGENNVVLFDPDGQPHNDKVGVVQVIRLVDIGGRIEVTRYTPSKDLMVGSDVEIIT